MSYWDSQVLVGLDQAECVEATWLPSYLDPEAFLWLGYWGSGPSYGGHLLEFEQSFAGGVIGGHRKGHLKGDFDAQRQQSIEFASFLSKSFAQNAPSFQRSDLVILWDAYRFGGWYLGLLGLPQVLEKETLEQASLERNSEYWYMGKSSFWPPAQALSCCRRVSRGQRGMVSCGEALRAQGFVRASSEGGDFPFYYQSLGYLVDIAEVRDYRGSGD
ncbi:hypothetical protein PIB30_067494 [Stylosanthes scabra]|uniref:Uncharacterized protein n=1 Tax=Stylosanthes scabra TaxID=79078 RepID=A0ABU6QMK2_9FABA|nr:hypothetical protein [Stylosanthes scabra]